MILTCPATAARRPRKRPHHPTTTRLSAEFTAGPFGSTLGNMDKRIVPAIVLLGGLCLAGCTGQQISARQRTLLVDGEDAYRRQQFTQASDTLTRFVTGVSPGQEGYEKALYLRGMSYAQSGRRTQAYRDLEACVRTGQEEEIVWKAYVSLGTLRFEDQQWPAAALAYRAAADRMPDEPPKDTVLYRLAVCYERSGQPAKARLPLREVIDKFPTSVSGRSARQKLNRLGTSSPAVTRSTPPPVTRTSPPRTSPPVAAPAPRPAAQVTRRAPAAGGSFAVQTGVFAVASNAQRQVQQLRQRNLNAYVRPEVVQRQTRHVVLVGPYATYDEARRRLAEIKRIVPDAVMWP